MKKFTLFIFCIICICKVKAQTNIVTYIGNTGRECLYDVTQLSDGTFLACGYAQSLAWLPAGTPTNIISAGNINNALDTMNAYGFIIQLSNDLQTILSCIHFPQGAVADIKYMKFTSAPYATTGDMYISGTTRATKLNEGGYFIAKLNNNFVNGVPTAMNWVRRNWAEGNVFENQPWDVGSDGKVVYIYGQSHAADWAQVGRYRADGSNDLVSNWRTHWDVLGAEYKGLANSYMGASTLTRSGIVLKKTGRCDLRSWTTADYNTWQSDGNGSMRKGKWPLDFLYNSPCNIASVSTSGPGYNGYSASSSQTYGGQSISIDKRNNSIFIGMNTKSVLPGGLPDFEPAVICMDSSGSLVWYSRLYHEVMPNTPNDTVTSTPDQYIDGLAIDYTNNNLVVNARTHGNNVSNFWKGNAVASNPSANGFQNQFTGTNGNIHLEWIGKLSLLNGEFQGSTFMGEYNNNANANATPLSDPNLFGWPNPNAGWAELNTTRTARNSIRVSTNGSVLVGAVGRHSMTTTNAYQKNVKPNATNATTSPWANFVRLYEPDLSKPIYSSLVTGQFDTITGANGDNTTIYGFYKTQQGIIGVGKHSTTTGTNNASGASIPTINVLPFGSSTPSNESAILFYYKSTNMTNPDDSMLFNNLLSGPLALSFRLSAYNKQNTNMLQWQVNYENENHTYLVQHSLDGNNFKSISPIIYSTTNSINNLYSFEHNNPADGANYYRILQKAINGTSQYSNTEKLFFDNPIGLNVYPNPSKKEIFINLTEQKIPFKIIDALGRIIKEGNVQNQNINLQGMQAGNYRLIITTSTNTYSKALAIE
jgi:hypothetical protein